MTDRILTGANVLMGATIVAAVVLLVFAISGKIDSTPSDKQMTRKVHQEESVAETATAKGPSHIPEGTRGGIRPKAVRQNGIYYIAVAGSPYEMGTQHGMALKPQIIDAIADYKANVIKMFGRSDAEKIIDWVLNKADFKRSILQYLPNALEELRGIADGAGVSEDDLLLANMFEEVYEAAPSVLGLTPMAGVGQGCTAFTVGSGSKRFAGQNMDYSGNLLGKQLVVRYTYPDQQILMYGFVGQVGGIGVNSQGLSVFVNTLPQGKKRHNEGLGSTFVLRMLLEQPSVDAALAKLKKVPRFGGTNYTLTDMNKGMIAESDADQVVLRIPDADPSIVVGTNHALHLDYRHDIPGIYENGEPVRSSIVLTVERMEYTQRFLEAIGDRMDVDDLKNLLTVTPVNIYHPAFMTLQSGIVKYDGGQILFFVSGGYNPQREWNAYQF